MIYEHAFLRRNVFYNVWFRDFLCQFLFYWFILHLNHISCFYARFMILWFSFMFYVPIFFLFLLNWKIKQQKNQSCFLIFAVNVRDIKFKINVTFLIFFCVSDSLWFGVNEKSLIFYCLALISAERWNDCLSTQNVPKMFNSFHSGKKDKFWRDIWEIKFSVFENLLLFD